MMTGMPSVRDWERRFSLRMFGLVLGLLLFLFFYEVILGFQTFFYRDYGVLAFPALHFQHESFWRGEFPLWNHFSNCGVPFAAQWGSLSFYPPSLFYLLLPLPWSANLFCLLHLWLAGVGMYCCARKWSGSQVGGFLAGLGFVFNGFTFSCLLWPNYAVALGWMPWVVFLVHKASTHGKSSLVPAILVSSLQMLSGVPETILITWLLAAFLILISDSELPFPKTAGRFTLIAVLVAGICAIQLLPFFDLLHSSQRASSFDTGKWSIPSWGWINFLAPLFRSFQSPEGVSFQPGQEFVSSYYLPIFLAAASAFAALRRDLRAAALLAVCLLSVALAMGNHFPLYPALKTLFPFLGVARFPVKFLVAAVFLLPLAAAAGARLLFASEVSLKPFFLIILTLCLTTFALLLVLPSAGINVPSSTVWINALTRLVILALASLALWKSSTASSHRRRLLFTSLALLCIPLDFATHTSWQNPTLPPDVLKPGFWQPSGAPKPQPGVDRLFILPSVDEALNFSPIPNTLTNFLGKRLAEWSSLNLIDSIPKVNGSATLQIREQAQLQSQLYSNNVPPSALLDFLAVSHISNPETKISFDLRNSALPWITGGAVPQIASPPQILRFLFEPGFDPSAVVFLENELHLSTPLGLSKPQISSITMKANQITFRVKNDSPAFITLAETFHPGWRATVDGSPQPILRANYAFMGILTEPGEHQLRLQYKDPRLLQGAFITSLSLACLLALALLERTRFRNLL